VNLLKEEYLIQILIICMLICAAFGGDDVEIHFEVEFGANIEDLGTHSGA
jgi:hypothetical protein